MVVKMVVKNRCPHLRGPPADSSGSVVTERGRDEAGIDYRSLITGMAVARSIPRPPVDALLVPQSRARGSPTREVVRLAQIRRLGRSPSCRPLQRRSDRVVVPVAVLVSRARTVDQFRVPVDGPMSALCGHVRGLRRRAHPDDRRAPALGELDRGEPDPPEAPVTSSRSDPTAARWSMFSAVE